ncbi:hypothetical protein BABINDRAFT_17860, partial [Babjeviella inositovora NRRL Y-12698]
KREDRERFDNNSESEDPYATIRLDHILAPIYHPSDVVHHPAISKTFHSQVTRNLAQQTIEIIEKEQDTVIQLMKLMNVFLGDDADSILADNIDLPDYDHNLTSNVTKELEGDEVAAKPEFEERRITRQQLLDEEDPFFALPKLSADVNFGIDAESAEETRQLTQIALQRSEEYIRCMTSLRMGLIRSDRLKDQLFKWCKEM